MARKTWSSGEILTATDLNTLVVQAALGSSRTLHIGTATFTTDASGYATITHGAGFTPTVVLAIWAGNSLAGGAGPVTGTDTYGATTFRVRMVAVSTSGLIIAYICAA